MAAAAAQLSARSRREVLEYSVFEALEGHGSRLAVTLFADGALQVDDDGRGLPVELHPREPAALRSGQAERCGPVHFISFRAGELHTGLTVTGITGAHVTGMALRVWCGPGALCERVVLGAAAAAQVARHGCSVPGSARHFPRRVGRRQARVVLPERPER